MKRINKNFGRTDHDSLQQKLEAYQRQAQLSKLAPRTFAAKEHIPLSLIVPLAAAALTPFAALAQACPGAGGNSFTGTPGAYNVFVDLDNDAVNDIRLFDDPNDLILFPLNTTLISVVNFGAYWYAVRHTGAITTAANFRGIGQLSKNGTGNYSTMEYSPSATNDQWQGAGVVTGCIGVKKGTRIGFVQVSYDNNNDSDPSTPAGASINAITLGSYGLASAGVATVTCASCATLPVEMRFFKGEIRQKKAVLLWETATESNNRGFEIEKSTDGTNFFKIGWVEGQGNSTRAVDYSFEDKTLQANQVCYYRLKQVDLDGRFDYTKIVSLALDNGGLTLHDFAPNPATAGFTYLKFDALTEGDVQITLFDATGRVAKEVNTAYIAGSNGVRLDLADLVSGVYYVKVQSGTFIGYKPLSVR